jgi:uncharacterized membrane protein YedE/YeeE
MSILAFGLITGMLFGFLLQKGRVLRFDKQIGTLRLIDLTIFKFMGTSVIVAMIGVYLLVDLGQAKLDLLPTVLGKNILGGLLFGVGWAVLGYCPGTSAGAAGEGRWDALFGALGMIAAAAIMAEAYSAMTPATSGWGNFGTVTIPEALGVNHWAVIALFVILYLLFFRWVEKKGL